MRFFIIALLAFGGQAKNPEYDARASCKTGSWVRLIMKVTGTELAIEFKWTLLEITKEKAVVERKSSAAGHEDSTEKEEVPSAREKKWPGAPAGPPGVRPGVRAGAGFDSESLRFHATGHPSDERELEWGCFSGHRCRAWVAQAVRGRPLES